MNRIFHERRRPTKKNDVRTLTNNRDQESTKTNAQETAMAKARPVWSPLLYIQGNQSESDWPKRPKKPRSRINTNNAKNSLEHYLNVEPYDLLNQPQKTNANNKLEWTKVSQKSKRIWRHATAAGRRERDSRKKETTTRRIGVVRSSSDRKWWLLLPPYVLHELLADGSNVLGEGGRKHHHLLLMGRHPEDLLHVMAHVCNKRKQT